MAEGSFGASCSARALAMGSEAGAAMPGRRRCRRGIGWLAQAMFYLTGILGSNEYIGRFAGYVLCCWSAISVLQQLDNGVDKKHQCFGMAAVSSSADLDRLKFFWREQFFTIWNEISAM
jgi:hypothetical protein